LLKLGYPGGPIIDKLAQTGNPHAFALPEGKISLPGGGYHLYDCSFSGLKTAVLRLVQQFEKEGKEVPIADVVASFQDTIARSLTKKAITCARNYGLDTITVGGGVAANSGLRKHLQAAASKHNFRVLFPPLKFCTDNAAMIGCAAAEHLSLGRTSPLTLGVHSRLSLNQVMQLYEN
jgi:N6-L-threonylcarbamoyladenine synthase